MSGFYSSKYHGGSGEMAQRWLRILSGLAEDPISAPTTHTEQFTSGTPSPRGSCTSVFCNTSTYNHTWVQTQTNIIKITLFKIKPSLFLLHEVIP